MPGLLKENARLQALVKDKNERLEVVDWYINMFENGQDTRRIAKELFKLSKKHKKLQKEYDLTKNELETKIKYLEKKLQVTNE